MAALQEPKGCIQFALKLMAVATLIFNKEVFLWKPLEHHARAL